MLFVHQLIAATVLVLLTLLLQSAGMSVLIEWLKTRVKRGLYNLGPLHSAYGDLVLPHAWRILGPIEAVTGVLMCGLSASFLFAIVNRLVEHDSTIMSALATNSVLERTSPVA
jgi:voltage-gated potassium channel